MFLLPGCGGRPRGFSPEEANPTPYLPPTAAAPAASPLPIVAEAVELSRPTLTPPCTANLSFVEDLTIPDGTRMLVGENLDKRWLVENNGACNWDENYRVRLIAGPSLGAQTEQALYPARSGTQAILRIQFTAPPEGGTYRSAWQAHDPHGQPFGDLFFIDFVVFEPIAP
jgi:hypothetical protein